MREKFARWDLLFLQYIKRDWKRIVLWILGLGLFSAAFIPAFYEIAKEEGFIAMYETLQNPAMIALVGPTPVDSAANYTVGAMYAHEMLLFCSLFAMIVSVLHVIRHTRREEELGLTEIIRSFQVGRQANSLAIFTEILLINLLLTCFISVVMISFRMDTITIEGSFLFGGTIGMAGVIGAGIALLFSQIMPSSSTATGSTLGVIGLLYLFRAGTDLSNVKLSMLNPLGWTYLTYPFTENNWLFLLYAFIFSMVIVSIAFTLEGARDMGAGYLPEREGRAYAKKSLLSVPGLWIRLNRGIIISWLLAFLIIGAAYGSVYGDIQTFVEGNDLLRKMFISAGFSLEESFTVTIMMVMICLVAILPIIIINKLFAEENRSHLSQIYATKVTRGQLYWTNVGLAVLSSLIGILLAAGSLGITAIAVMEDQTVISLQDFIISGYNFFPAILFFISLATLALGWAPRLGKGAYIYLTYSFLLHYFGEIVDSPNWLLKTAIQSWLPQMPMEDFSLFVFIVISLISGALMVIGSIGYKRRDFIEEN